MAERDGQPAREAVPATSTSWLPGGIAFVVVAGVVTLTVWLWRDDPVSSDPPETIAPRQAVADRAATRGGVQTPGSRAPRG